MTVKKSGAIIHYSGLAGDTKPTGTTVPIGSTFYEYDTNDTYFTPDNTNWYVKDSKSTKIVTVQNTISAAGAYASGDVISTTSAATALTWDFLGAAGANGGNGEIVQALIESDSNICSAVPILHIFTTSAPNSVRTDNSQGNAPTQADVSTNVYIGHIDFPVMSAFGATTANSQAALYSTASCLPLHFVCASGEDDIHGILMTATAATFASKTITIKLWVKRH